MKNKKDILIAFIITILMIVASIEEPTPTKEIEEPNNIIRWKQEQNIETQEEYIEPSVEPLAVAKVAKPSLISLGTFRVTAYCACEKCCGQWSGGPTASGVMPTANHTIAVDPNVIPFGTEVIINGMTYVAEDTGSGINQNCIDLYFDSHQEAIEWGVQYIEVFIKGGVDNGY